VLAIAIDDRLLGQELLLAATRLGRRGSVELTDAALVGRNRVGKPRITQTREMNPSQGAMMGAWWGSLIGLIAFGMVGWLGGAALGAGLGWWRARSKDIGVPNDWMLGLAERLYPGEVAAVFQMRNVYPTHLIRELRRFNGRLLADTVADADQTEIEDALAYVV
jgi:uncharacterized membrane protein